MNTSKKPKGLLLFDLAGTSVSDEGVVCAAFRHVGAEVGLFDPDDPASVDVADELVSRNMGRDKVAVFRVWREAAAAGGRSIAAVPAAAELAGMFAARIRDVVDAGGMPPIAGIHGVIATVKDAGIAVGCTSGFDVATSRRVVRAAELAVTDERLVVGSDEVAAGRPAPDLIHEAMRRAGVSDPARVGVVGDTPADLDAGLAAGCGMVIGVGTGAAGVRGLSAHLRSRAGGMDAQRTVVHIVPSVAKLGCEVRPDGTIVAVWPVAGAAGSAAATASAGITEAEGVEGAEGAGGVGASTGATGTPGIAGVPGVSGAAATSEAPS
ncbi:MAG: HAD family hydrolase [Phycisphaerales bacterium]